MLCFGHFIVFCSHTQLLSCNIPINNNALHSCQWLLTSYTEHHLWLYYLIQNKNSYDFITSCRENEFLWSHYHVPRTSLPVVVLPTPSTEHRFLWLLNPWTGQGFLSFYYLLQRSKIPIILLLLAQNKYSHDFILSCTEQGYLCFYYLLQKTRTPVISSHLGQKDS